MATVISDINIVDTEKSFEVVNVSNRNLTMMFSVKARHLIVNSEFLSTGSTFA